MTVQSVSRFARRILLAAPAVFVVAAGLGASDAPRAFAQAAAVAVVAEEVISPDPRSIAWEVQISGAPVAEAVLMYQRYNPEGGLGGEVRAEVPSRGTGVIRAELEANDARTYIPVGTEFTYYWRFTTEDGAVTETAPQSFLFMDGQYDWRSIEDQNMVLYYYGDEALARSVLDSSLAALHEMSDLLQTEIPFTVNLLLWDSGRDGQFAQRSRGGVYSDQSITGGARVAPHIVHVYDRLGLTFEDIARHEVTHVVVHQAGDGPFTQVPAWLDEGTATYAQANKGGRFTATSFAIQGDSTIRLRNMVAATNRPELIDLFYGQSWFVVEYIIDTYGADSFAAIFASLRGGNRIDEALLEVLGVDQDGLYNEWRVAVGLEPVEFAEAAGAIVRPEATRAPLSIPTSVAAGSTESDSSRPDTNSGADGTAVAAPDEGSDATMAIIIAAVAVLVAGILGGLGFRLMRS